MPSEFFHEAERLMRDLSRQPLKILVWGPGEPAEDTTDRRGYEKRVQIRDAIRDKFPSSEVYFSEDPEMQDISSAFKGQLDREVMQAWVADFVIVLDMSRGSDLELDHFIPTYSWFRKKVHVFLPEEYVNSGGLADEVFNELNPDRLEGFTREEFEECSLARVKAINATTRAALVMKMAY